jgi:hypothetical protein
VNVEFSNEPLAKAKSWELRFYRKALRNASKKTHRFLSQAVYRWIGFSGDDQLGAKAARYLATC